MWGIIQRGNIFIKRFYYKNMIVDEIDVLKYTHLPQLVENLVLSVGILTVQSDASKVT